MSVKSHLSREQDQISPNSRSNDGACRTIASGALPSSRLRAAPTGNRSAKSPCDLKAGEAPPLLILQEGRPPTKPPDADFETISSLSFGIDLQS